VEHAYRCLGCLDRVVTRAFDVSHLSATCPDCGSFERHANDAVVERFESFEASPPAELDWAALSRREKLLVSERVVRAGRDVADIAPD
jgi:hypothetical protein